MGYSAEQLRSFPIEMLDELIERYQLHESYPVQATVLYDELNIRRYKDMTLPKGSRGFSVRHPSRGFGIAVFDRKLEGAELQHTIFHELGHLLLHSAGRPHGSVTGPGGMVRREELEADMVAAYLAAPGIAVLELFLAGYTAPQVAALLNITPRLLQLRAELMVARNEFGVRDHPFYINMSHLEF